MKETAGQLRIKARMGSGTTTPLSTSLPSTPSDGWSTAGVADSKFTKVFIFQVFHTNQFLGYAPLAFGPCSTPLTKKDSKLNFVKKKSIWAVQKLTGHSLKVVWANFST
jgi:hypothetical protein